MKKLYIGNREIRTHELILANQAWLKSGWFYIEQQDSDNYDTAKAQSPEAGEEFLARRKERNRIEAENPPPVKPTPPQKPAFPLLALSETMLFMQKVAQDGLLLDLDENQKLRAQGWRPVVEKWVPKIMTTRGAIRQTLLQISSTHGDTDPLNLRELVEEANYYRDCDRLRELQEIHGFARAVFLHDEEKTANMVYVIFPDESAE